MTTEKPDLSKDSIESTPEPLETGSDSSVQSNVPISIETTDAQGGLVALPDSVQRLSRSDPSLLGGMAPATLITGITTCLSDQINYHMKNHQKLEQKVIDITKESTEDKVYIAKTETMLEASSGISLVCMTANTVGMAIFSIGLSMFTSPITKTYGIAIMICGLLIAFVSWLVGVLKLKLFDWGKK